MDQIKVIKTDKAYEAALEQLEALMDLDPAPGTDEVDMIELLTLLIEKYEENVYPVELPTPVEAIKFRMDQQKLKKKDLVPYIGSMSKVSEVLSGKQSLTLKMIRSLHKNLNISAEVLLNERGADLPNTNFNIQWEKFPLNYMWKNGWFINFTGSLHQVKAEAEELVSEFLQRANLLQSVNQALYRRNRNKRTGVEMDEYALWIWQARVLIKAQKVNVSAPYTEEKLNEAFYDELRRLSTFSGGPKLAQEFLLQHGIILIIEPHLKKTHLDGAVMMTENNTPVIGLTIRHDRIDNFWFCLFHELAHLELHLKDLKKVVFFDDLDFNDGDCQEEEADSKAIRELISEKDWYNRPAYASPAAVKEYAKQIKIHPAILAGRIRREQNNYRLLSRLIGNGEVRKLFTE